MRLIDADKLEPDRFSTNGGLAISQSQIANLPTVEAIPKDQYENRLKADIRAMLTDIQSEIRHFMYDVNPSSSESDYACNYMIDIIQQKINSFNDTREGENEQE